MKNSKELVEYTLNSLSPMREWWNREYKNAENCFKSWLKDFHINNKKDDELVRDYNLYNLDGNVIFHNYTLGLVKAHEEFTMDTVVVTIDILLQEMAKILSNHMHNQYPCLQNHYVVMRANKFKECVMFIGPLYKNPEASYLLFGDEGVFVTQGLEACYQSFNNIDFFK